MKTTLLTLFGVTLLLLAPGRARAADPMPLAPERWLLAAGECAWRDGVLNWNAEEDGARVFHTAASYSDFVYTLDFQVPGEGGTPTVGVVFRSADSERYYFVHYDLQSSQVILYAANPVPQWVELGRQRDVPIRHDQWHTAKVVAQGARVEAYLDTTRVLSMDLHLPDPSLFTTGLVGLRCDAGRAQFRNPAITGTVTPLAKEWSNKMHAKDWIVVSDGGRGQFAAWPDLLRLPDGTLICSLYQGYGHGSPPTDQFPNCGKMVCVFSSDKGKTWSPPVTMVDTDADDHDGHLSRLKDGRILCNYFAEQFYREENGKRVRIQGNGCWRFDLCLIESRDEGRTWSAPQTIPTHWTYCSVTAGQIIELPEGDLVMPVYGWDTDGKNAGVGVIRSSDGGKSWSKVTLLVSGLAAGDANETDLARLNDGRLLAMIRPKMLQCYSADGGKTWTEPAPAGVAGHAPCLLRTSAGPLVCAIRSVGKANGTGVVVSADNGATWRGPYPVDTVPGAYPGLAELADGTIYIVYYEEGGGSKIRAKRFRLTPDGIEIIPPQEW